MNIQLLQGDCIDRLKDIDENSVDSVVTDPPYGLSFMGKAWDHEVPSVEVWREAFRVLKPGGHLISFGGTRTYHRMTVNIEDAGFEIRDMVSWIYGSGFPKSLNIGKAVDKLQGKSDNEWNGWGTALKPSHEDCVLARKPFDNDWYFDKMVRELLTTLCQSPLLAPTAKKLFQLNPNEQGEVVNIVQWLAAENTNTQDALFALMDTLQSDGKTESMTWNIELLCLNTLAGLYDHWSTFTTEMKPSLITDLKTLNYYLAQITQNSITKGETKQNGNDVSVSLAATVLNALQSKLLITQELSATESAIDRAGDRGLRPNADVSVLARKPLSEKTVAANVLKWGTGGLNIDGSRVGTEEMVNQACGAKGHTTAMKWGSKGKEPTISQGRFPANLLHDGSDEVLEVFPESKTTAGVKNLPTSNIYGGNSLLKSKTVGTGEVTGYTDSGSAARFFYSAKVSKKERMGSSHPTMKPIALMEYMVKLITPPNGTVLDPFMGSGSTGMAAKNLGHNFIGIELEEEYMQIARARIG